jgi:hypothetical protein
VRHNTFFFTADHCIMAFPDGCAFFESGPLSNWTIESNNFTGCGAPELQDGRPTGYHERADIFVAACVPGWTADGRPTERGAPMTVGHPFTGGGIRRNIFEQAHYPHPAVALYGFDGLNVSANVVSVLGKGTQSRPGTWARSPTSPDIWWLSPGNFSKHWLTFSCSPCGGVPACKLAANMTEAALDAIPTSDPFSCSMIGDRLVIENSVHCGVGSGNICDGHPCKVPANCTSTAKAS